VKLAQLFSDHLVIQREMPVPVWGWAEAGETISVELAGVTAVAVAGPDGSWRVTLPPMSAGGPFELIARGVSGACMARDVLVGEVWICSGQSNMEWSLNMANDAEAEMATADDSSLRMFTAVHLVAVDPASDIEGTWTVCTPETVGPWSAVGYFFARELRRRLGVPVGMLHTSWGGTPAEAWTSREALAAEPELHHYVAALEAFGALGRSDLEQLQRGWNAQMERQMPELRDEIRAWLSPDYDDAAWPSMTLPTAWQDAGVPCNGGLCFRLPVDLPASWAGKPLMVNLGAIDKSDVTYFNGIEVGSLLYSTNPQSWSIPRTYTVPGHLVRAGRNVIAVRAFSHVFDGGLCGPADAMTLTAEGETPITLAGEWRYQIEENQGDFRQPISGFYPSCLYNAMLHPLIPAAIRGAIWYQGESNAGLAVEYRTLFATMIRDWRARWGQGDFPFYFVQLANYMAQHDVPTDTDWAWLREAQTMTLALPNTGMAVAIDVGEADDIHPRNKQDVGYRLALNALAGTYGLDVVFAGPLFRSMAVEGNAIRLHFDHVGGGLVARGDELTGFAVAGDDRGFAWADARLDGDTVVVSSPEVPTPVAVRYSWADNPVCNLYNAEGLPASPFRTDTWAREGQVAPITL